MPRLQQPLGDIEVKTSRPQHLNESDPPVSPAVTPTIRPADITEESSTSSSSQPI